jgi:hypothetical protein
MQEVRGSNPLSSTQVREIIPNPEPTVHGPGTAAKYSNAAAQWPLRQPGSGPGTGRSCWHDQLKPPAKTDPQRPEQEERSFPSPLPLALLPAYGAFWPVTLAAGATCQPAMPGRAVVVPARMSADGLRHGAAWRADWRRARPAQCQGASVARRGATWRILGAPPRRQARAKRVTAHRSGGGRRAG